MAKRNKMKKVWTRWISFIDNMPEFTKIEPLPNVFIWIRDEINSRKKNKSKSDSKLDRIIEMRRRKMGLWKLKLS